MDDPKEYSGKEYGLGRLTPMPGMDPFITGEIERFKRNPHPHSDFAKGIFWTKENPWGSAGPPTEFEDA